MRPGNIARRRQHQNDRADHDLVSDGIEEDAQFRHCPLRPRQIAVEIIGHAHQAVKTEGQRIAGGPARAHLRRPKQRDEQRHRDDTRKREQIGQRQHSCRLPQSDATHKRDGMSISTQGALDRDAANG